MREEQIDAVARERLADVFAVVSEVRTGTGQPQYRRRVHLSLTAAQRAVQRAHERDCEARVILCRLEPLQKDEGDEWTHDSRRTT